MRDPNINYAREEVCHNCLYCNLDTAGQHEPDCPLYQERQSITINQPPEGWNGNPKRLSYADWGKEMRAKIDAHPEWGVEYL